MFCAGARKGRGGGAGHAIGAQEVDIADLPVADAVEQLAAGVAVPHIRPTPTLRLCVWACVPRPACAGYSPSTEMVSP